MLKTWMSWRVRSYSLAALVLTFAALAAGAQSPMVIALENGSNNVDLLGDGTTAQVFVAWRGNYNAHGYSLVTFSVLAMGDLDDKTKVWQVVPFFGGEPNENGRTDAFRTFEAADCILGDLRLVSHPHAPVEVVIAKRELGSSFADSAPVRFSYYTLARNTDDTPGWPPYYFKLTRTVPAKRQYCDVNEAFRRELGLSARGIGYAKGGR